MPRSGLTARSRENSCRTLLRKKHAHLGVRTDPPAWTHGNRHRAGTCGRKIELGCRAQMRMLVRSRGGSGERCSTTARSATPVWYTTMRKPIGFRGRPLVRPRQTERHGNADAWRPSCGALGRARSAGCARRAPGRQVAADGHRAAARSARRVGHSTTVHITRGCAAPAAPPTASRRPGSRQRATRSSNAPHAQARGGCGPAMPRRACPAPRRRRRPP